MPENTAKRGVQAFVIVSAAVFLAVLAVAVAVRGGAGRPPRNSREDVMERYRGNPPPAVYYNGAARDPVTGDPLAEDDPRRDFGKWAQENLDQFRNRDQSKDPVFTPRRP